MRVVRPACEAILMSHEYGRNPALDGIRGVAILMVMVYHFTAPVQLNTTAESAVLAITRQGWLGVELFFALSGFLITGTLWDAKSKSAPRLLRTFYARRVLRIFPLYYGVIVLALLSGAIVPSLRTEGYDRFLGDQLWLWLYGVNVGQSLEGLGRFYYGVFDFTHFWTLAVEEHFYLIWPLLLLRLSRRGAIAMCVALVAIGLGLRVWGAVGATGWAFALTASVRQSSSLAMGAILALLVRADGARSILRAAPVCGVLAGTLYLAILGTGSRGPGWVKPVFGPLLLGACFTGLIAHIVTAPGSRVTRALSTRSLRFFGTYSYGLYAYHHFLFPLWLWLMAYLYAMTGVYRVAVFGTMLMAFGSSVALAMLSWAVFESPILSLKRYFEYSRPV